MTGSGLAGVVIAALVGEDVPPVIQNSTTTMIATTTAEMATETSVRRLRRRRWLWRHIRCADDPWLVGEDISPESTSAASRANGAAPAREPLAYDGDHDTMNNRPPTPPWAMFLVAVALVIAIWILGQTIGQVLIVFSFSVVLALLLNPAVRVLRRRRVPRGLAVAIVFLALLALVIGVIALVVTPVRSQIQEIQTNLPTYRASANGQINSLQTFFNHRGWHIDVRTRLSSFANDVENRAIQGTGNVLSYSLDVLNMLVLILVTLVASIYMVLDAPRILRLARRIAGEPGPAFLRRTENTLVRYLRAQVLVSLLISGSAGIVLWLLGETGVYPLGATFAVTFVTWVFIMDFVPYVGPVLGAIPPVALALVTSLTAAVCVVVAFVVIHEVVRLLVPKAMGDAAGVQPLVVIFGLLIGAQLAGVVGVVLAIPMVVIAKEAATELADYSVARRAANAGGTAAAVEPPETPTGIVASPGTSIGTGRQPGRSGDEAALEPDRAP